MAEKATDLFKYASQSHQELDSYFSIRRTNRKPLEENAVMVSYEALEKEMASPTSTIYKGQIVVTNGPKEGNAVSEDKDSRFFMPWLIKTDNDQAKDQFYADRVMTGSYTAYFLNQRYVTKYQIGTKYTGVGQWADVKGEDTENGSTTYTEIFNDYNSNVAPIHEKDDEEMPYLSHTHIEGYGNYADHSYAHVEGSGNMAYARNVHIEGEQNSAYGVAAHAGGLHTYAKGDYSTTLGRESVAYGESSLSAGYKTTTYAPYSIALGKEAFTNGEGAVAIGVQTESNGLGSVAEGQGSKAKAGAGHAEGINTLVTGEAGHAEGISSVANGQGSHAEGSASAYGTYSHAEGSASAYGTYSHAEGAGITYGNYSHVEGTSTIGAESTYSHAEGNSTIAPGKEYSHSEGQAIVEGNYSHGEGTSTVTGDKSHGEGASIVKGTYSHAEGKGQVEGHYAHAEGEGYVNGDYAHAEGQGQATGKYAHAEGTGVASQEFAHAEGSNTTASGQYSHAEGANTTASGISSHAEGYFTVASNNYAHAEGNNTIANGMASHAEGNENEITSDGNYAHVEGKSNLAKGEYSHIEGQSNEANAPYVHIEGQSNIAANTATASHIEGLENNVSAEYAHAEGRNTYIDASSTYSHSEGYGGSAYGVASHVEGFMSHARGNYSHASGFCTIAPNAGEFSGGTYNRAYTYNVRLQDGVEITSVPNEFARIGGKYIPGRYPTGIDESNATTKVAMYDASYETIFTIGNGSYDNQSLAIGPLEYVMETQAGKEVSYDAGQYVKKYSRHNIMDIRKNGQMYYDGGMIIGGETVAPVSYSYVNSLGPTAYLTTVMRALLVQPEYYRPSLQYAIWYTGANLNYTATNANQSPGWSYFQNSTKSDGVCEVGMTTQLQLRFRAFNVGTDKPSKKDPLYDTSLGNMLGYSTGVTNVTYQIINSNTNASAQSFTTREGNELLAGMKGDNIKYQAKKLDAKNYDYGAYYCAYCNAVDAKGPFYVDGSGNTLANDYNTQYQSGLYSSQQVLTTNLKLDKEGTFTVWKATSYTFNPATQMYFQQLMEKNTYIPDDGFAPLDKFGKTTVTSTATFAIHARYRIYYGVTNAVPSDKWKDWTQADLINSTTYGLGTNGNGKGQVYGTENARSGSTQDVTQAFSVTVKTCWFAFPEDIYKLGRYNTAAVPSDKFMWYKNAMNAESSLDTGRITDTISSARPMYEYVTNNPISPSGLKYHIVAVSAPGGITKGTWGFRFVRK